MNPKKINDLLWNIDEEMKNELYIIIEWPESQIYMEEKGCLYVDNWQLDGTIMVSLNTYYQVTERLKHEVPKNIETEIQGKLT